MAKWDIWIEQMICDDYCDCGDKIGHIESCRPTCALCGERIGPDVLPNSSCSADHCVNIKRQPPKDTDPTPWCNGCGAKTQAGCSCGPIAEND